MRAHDFIQEPVDAAQDLLAVELGSGLRPQVVAELLQERKDAVVVAVVVAQFRGTLRSEDGFEAAYFRQVLLVLTDDGNDDGRE